MKKQLAAAAAVLALSAGFTMSASASLYSASGNGWVDNDTTHITVESQNGNNVLHMRGNNTDNAVKRYLKLNDGNASWYFYAKIKMNTSYWINSMRVAEEGGGVYNPYRFDTGTWTFIDLENGWQQAKHSVWYENKDHASLQMLAGGNGDYYMDDVVVTKGNGDVVLFDDFETEITNVSADDNGITWTNVAGVNYNEIKIYKENADNSKSLVKTVPYGTTSVSVAELGGSMVGTWYVKPVKTVSVFDGSKNPIDKELEFNGEKVTVLAPYELSMEAYAGDTKIETLQAGTITVKATIKNNKIADGVSAQLIAILKKDGKVVEVKGSPVQTAAMNQQNTDYTVNFTIPSDETGYELGMYLWDSLEGMKIVSPSKTITQ